MDAARIPRIVFRIDRHDLRMRFTRSSGGSTEACIAPENLKRGTRRSSSGTRGTGKNYEAAIGEWEPSEGLIRGMIDSFALRK